MEENENDRRDVCWYCGGKLIWNSDFDWDDIHDDGRDGTVTHLYCSKCGARVTYERTE